MPFLRRHRAHEAAVRATAATTAAVTDPNTVFESAMRAASTVLAPDAWAGVLLDPATLMNCGGVYRHGLAAEHMPRMLDIEYREGDLNLMPELARRENPVGVLSADTGGEPERSVRHRDLFQPLGLRDEMRVLLRDGGRTWGALVLVRGRAFDPHEAAFAAQLSPVLGAALRRSLVLGGAQRPPDRDDSVLILLTEDYDVLSASPRAEAWLDRLPEQRAPGCAELPASVYGVAAKARADTFTGTARAMVRTRAGEWAVLHAWRLTGGTGTNIAVAVESATGPDRADLLMDAYSLTERERDITLLVLRGHSTKEIGGALHLAEYTVQDHLKSVFDKTGVRSRRALVGQVFFHHYA
ncbi:LuxR C-terminal-related transcriptional regulator [Streptomyces bambusae]|uniref:GAF domain-containing protein n=1 Tax=Streptomyces bambusae TaxID=1550616 RepID=A0ABS6ZBI9_9ACTN|nr:LuxR C-terminal-related transcriptional regulator [Streptomyces bambusae]MBW5485125.1 GAF domain-containing protein [Streptomyces bambusae]